MLKQRILQDAYVNNKLIAFRTEKEEWGDNIIGHVKELTPESITINEIDEHGIPIGVSTFKMDALIDIVTEDKTLKCLDFLEKHHNHFSQKKCTTVWGNGQELRNRISEIMKERKPITLFVEDDDTNVIGIIEDIDEKSVLVAIIDSYGENDGKILVPLETINGVRWESLEDNTRWLLYQNRQ